jgi:hypothetical protein
MCHRSNVVCFFLQPWALGTENNGPGDMRFKGALDLPGGRLSCAWNFQLMQVAASTYHGIGATGL